MIVTYVLRTISGFDYNSFADIGFWDFTNGYQSSMRCSRYSNKNFPPGTDVCCILTGAAESKILEAIIKIESISPDGLIKFGEIIGDRWKFELPNKNNTIIDERANLKGKVFGAGQIEIPKELPKLPNPQEEEE